MDAFEALGHFQAGNGHERHTFAGNYIGMSAIKVLICAIATLLITGSCHAQACSRIPAFTKQQAFAAASEIFRATVIRAELDPFVPPGFATQEPHIVKVYYDLKTVIKGAPLEDGPVLTTKFYYGGCGVPVVVGVDYIFYIEPMGPDVDPELMSGAHGWISVFDSTGLPADEALAQEDLAEVEALLDRHPD